MPLFNRNTSKNKNWHTRKYNQALDETYLASTGLYRLIKNLGSPSFTTSIDTACVSFERIPEKNNTPAIVFNINPDLFKQLPAEQVAFVIAHEALHVAKNHLGERWFESDKYPLKHVFELAQELVVNDTLTDSYQLQPPTRKNQDGEETRIGVFGDEKFGFSFNGLDTPQAYPKILELLQQQQEQQQQEQQQGQQPGEGDSADKNQQPNTDNTPQQGDNPTDTQDNNSAEDNQQGDTGQQDNSTQDNTDTSENQQDTETTEDNNSADGENSSDSNPGQNEETSNNIAGEGVNNTDNAQDTDNTTDTDSDGTPQEGENTDTSNSGEGDPTGDAPDTDLGGSQAHGTGPGEETPSDTSNGETGGNTGDDNQDPTDGTDSAAGGNGSADNTPGDNAPTENTDSDNTTGDGTPTGDMGDPLDNLAEETLTQGGGCEHTNPNNTTDDELSPEEIREAITDWLNDTLEDAMSNQDMDETLADIINDAISQGMVDGDQAAHKGFSVGSPTGKTRSTDDVTLKNMTLDWARLLREIDPRILTAGRKNLGAKRSRETSFARRHRAFTAFQSRFILPGEAGNDPTPKGKEKAVPTIILALDYSGSTPSWFIEVIVALANSIPKEGADVRVITWSNDVVEWGPEGEVCESGGTDLDLVFDYAKTVKEDLDGDPYIVTVSDGEFWRHRYFTVPEENCYWVGIERGDRSSFEENLPAGHMDRYYDLGDLTDMSQYTGRSYY